MNEMMCNNNKGSSCMLSFTLKVIFVVVAAEAVIYLYRSIAGTDAGPVINSVIRILIIWSGIFVLFRQKKSTQGSEESKDSEITSIATKTDEDEFNQWPNIDALTRTSNERGLTISILELMALADRYGHKLSIGLIRVDGLDSLEKSVADEAMVYMAGLMTESLRMPDRIGRFKDNVFMVLLPESDIEGAAVVADRLRTNLEEGKNQGYSSELTVWIGMTEFQRGEDLQSLLDRVETATRQSRKEENGVFVKQA